ncbi:MAG: alanine--tRNA ligase-related protein, partial [Nanoarchaeota archaeon]
MLSDKEQKKQFKEVASKNPDSYYPTEALKKEGFFRNKCECCNKYFWNIDKDRKVCGDASCSGGFDISEGSPAKTKLSYIEVWKKVVSIFTKLGYEAIDRYPVIARWNPTTDFVMASIAAFQPYVITGEVSPPAKKLVIPQFSLRFGDIDNVGVTGSHCTGFVMIGQHAFVEEKEWDQEQLFMDIYRFLINGVGLSKSELTIHEDAWAGGGNFGPCMEF